ncbi:hypothetical protein M0R45_032011 [Rubus argutus]|uniref:Uncharacterized protein n=1 Tax=Rubus argutus TaxID=59490 RepID=A0AAW1WG08_RUBAR
MAGQQAKDDQLLKPQHGSSVLISEHNQQSLHPTSKLSHPPTEASLSPPISWSSPKPASVETTLSCKSNCPLVQQHLALPHQNSTMYFTLFITSSCNTYPSKSLHSSKTMDTFDTPMPSSPLHASTNPQPNSFCREHSLCSHTKWPSRSCFAASARFGFIHSLPQLPALVKFTASN